MPNSDLEVQACVRCHGKLLVHKGKWLTSMLCHLSTACGIADQYTLCLPWVWIPARWETTPGSGIPGCTAGETCAVWGCASLQGETWGAFLLPLTKLRTLAQGPWTCPPNELLSGCFISIKRIEGAWTRFLPNVSVALLYILLLAVDNNTLQWKRKY